MSPFFFLAVFHSPEKWSQKVHENLIPIGQVRAPVIPKNVTAHPSTNPNPWLRTEVPKQKYIPIIKKYKHLVRSPMELLPGKAISELTVPQWIVEFWQKKKIISSVRAMSSKRNGCGGLWAEDSGQSDSWRSMSQHVFLHVGVTTRWWIAGRWYPWCHFWLPFAS